MHLYPLSHKIKAGTIRASPVIPGVNILDNFNPPLVLTRNISGQRPAGKPAMNLSMIGGALNPWVGKAKPIRFFLFVSGKVIPVSLSID